MDSHDLHLDRCLALAVSGATREYPYHSGLVLHGPDDLRLPRESHPAFYGCFDWHSAVHAHWTMARLVRTRPHLPHVDAARDVLSTHLTAARLAPDLARFARPTSFERPYGWAWALHLEAELRAEPTFRAMADAMTPLADALNGLAAEYLPRLRRPVRAGTHANTAYAIAKMIDAATLTGRSAISDALRNEATRLFDDDRDWPLGYEPSGEDFLSPGLTEADLMRRVHPAADFITWLDRFLPDLAGRAPTPIVEVDMHDGRLAHLAGLNLSRAGALRGILGALPAADDRRPVLVACAEAHLAAGLGQVSSGSYAGEHWLGTFATHVLTDAGADAGSAA